jgi:hypothetical protein
MAGTGSKYRFPAEIDDIPPAWMIRALEMLSKLLSTQIPKYGDVAT